MRKRLFTYLLLAGWWAIATAQTERQFEIDWKIPASPPEDIQISDLRFFAEEYFGFHNHQIYFNHNFTGVKGDSTTLVVKDIRYSPFPREWAEKLLLKKENKFKGQIFPYLGRDSHGTFFQINAVKFENGKWYKLESFKVSFRAMKSRMQRQAANVRHSPLATGDWYRIEVNETGIYKIDKNLLQKLGINTDQIDPRNIKIYGWGGRMLPLKNYPGYPLMMPEIAIEVQGENDGRFDNEDYILFYAVGKQKWNKEYLSYNNIYTDKAYYYITVSPGHGKRIEQMNQPPTNASRTFNYFLSEKFYELDSVNIGKMGREWYSENFNSGTPVKEFSFQFDHLFTDKPAEFHIKAATDNPVPSRIRIFINDVEVNSLSLPRLSPASSSYGVKAFLTDQFDLTDPTANIRLEYDDAGYPAAKVFLDYFILKAYEKLIVDGKSFPFTHPDQHTTSDVVQYNLTSTSGLKAVWNITDPLRITKIENSSGSSDFSFKDTGGFKLYHTVAGNFLTPDIPEKSKIENSDLSYDTFYSDGQFNEPEYIIIAPEEFSSFARSFVSFHRDRGLKAFYAPLEKIYLEFGNGTQDIAPIRNYLRYVYQNASSPGKRLKFVTLFGDTSWDFQMKQYPDLEENINIIPSFQSQESFSLRSSYVTDDFFVCMDENEGLMDFSNIPDVAIGRIPVSTMEQATEVTEKLIDYYNTENYGAWHNTITFISDDSDNAREIVLLETTLRVSDKTEKYHPHFNQNKIYLDAYIQQTSAGGNRYPEAKRDILNTFEKGTLILNYIGHGNEYSWAHERILNLPEIRELRNKKRLPFVSTLTCEFGRFDNPKLYSGAELFVLNPNGGSFQMITTVREVMVSDAVLMNQRLFDYLLGMESTVFSTFRTPGESLMRAKQIHRYINNKLSLLGDAAMPLNFARPKIVITDLTGDSHDTIKALQHIRISGEIQDQQGNLLSDYNGKIYPVIYDKDLIAHTLNNDNNPVPIKTFKKLGPVIFRGQSDVKNGRFDFEFIVPKDLSPHYGKGRISFYAKQNQNLKQGLDTTYVFGGIDSQAPEDKTPPTVNLYMNDYNFADGGITDSNPFLLVNLFDENGINTVGGVGHDIVAILDDSAEHTFILNDYYTADANTYKSGKVRFKLYGLEPGWHTIKVRAWDVYNNSGEGEISFRVVKNNELEITRVLNYPNPFVDYTEFWFSHNRPYEVLDVQIEVYSASGKLVWSTYQQVETESYTSREIHWNGLDQFGQKIGKGVYFYKLSVRTPDGKSVEKWEKLVKL